MRFSSRIPSAFEPNPWAAQLAARRARGAVLIDLTEANPTRTGLAPVTPAPAESWGGDGAARYAPEPRGAEPARRAVARYYADRSLAIDADSIVLTSGTSEAYAHLFRLLADPGETVLVPRPSYPLFVPLGRAEGTAVRSYRLAYDGSWHVDFDDLERAIGPRTRAIVVVQPNHPTGSCLDPPEQARLDALAARRGLAVIADEVFGDFPWPARGEVRRAAAAPAQRHADHDATPAGARPDPRPPDVSPGAAPVSAALPSFIAEREAPTFVLSGLSKVCGLPQMKVGWIAVAGPAGERALALERLEWLGDLFLSVSTPAQLLLPAWLEGRRAYQERVRRRLAANVARLEQARARAPELTVLPGAGGWVAVLRLPQRLSEEAWSLALLDRDVIVHPGHFYDFESEPYVVISLIVEPGTLDRGLARLEELVRSG